jgi:hypothetical protein
MRITRETLLKIAADAAARQSRASPDLLAAFLSGSLLEEDFLLGGTTDIDLVFIYALQSQSRREIVRMTNEVHLDILHLDQKSLRDTRKLRVHPWMGPTLNACKVLYDPQHFLDFTQASVRGQFNRPDFVLERARQFADEARRIWMDLPQQDAAAGPAEVGQYLQALELAGNAIASLSGPPLTERRFLPGFRARALEVEKPGLYAGMLGLLGAPYLEGSGELLSTLQDWLTPWLAAYQAAGAQGEPAEEALSLHPDRLHYYSEAIQAMLRDGQAESALWPLLRTWTTAAQQLSPESPDKQAWKQAFSRLGLAGLAFTGRVEALDAYLDLVDETLEGWARANGAWNE